MVKQGNTVFSGFLWTFAERFGAQSVSFIVSIILARLLAPSDFGIIAIVLVFINLANALATGGLGNSLIQKKDADQIDFSSMFWFNIVFSIILYLLLFFVAPFIEEYYEFQGLATILRVLGIRILFTGINSIQRAFVARKMHFKFFFYATSIGTLFSAFVGIGMAYYGWGPWALVAQYLTNTIIDTLVLWFTIKWRPIFIFSYQRLKGLISYGWKLLCSSILSTLYVDLNSLVIGKMYSSSDLAYYNRGQKFPSVFVINLISAIETVLFPTMSKSQDDKVVLRNKVRMSVQLTSYVVFPLVVFLSVVSKDLIVFLLTDTWIESAKYLTISCISYALLPISIANIQAIKAVGRSDIYLLLDVFKKTIGIIFLVISLKYGVVAIAIAEVMSNILGFILNLFPNKRIIGYSINQQLNDLKPTVVLNLALLAILLILNSILAVTPFLKILIEFFVAVCFYLFLSDFFKIEAYRSIYNIVINKIKR